MSERNETISDIVAEMRRFGQRHWMHDEGQNIRLYSDRIEAAWEREKADLILLADTATKILDHERKEANRRVEEVVKNKPGDTAAMREALETALQTIRGIIDGTLARRNQSVFDCRDQLKAALSKPPRQCDVGTAEEQDDRMTLYCQTRKCESCPLWDNVNNGVRCEFTWAQMPYTEGGAK